MEYIHFEKQEGSLCAQHCLNSLLQGAYFTAVDLAQFAYELDEAERQTMAEGDVNSEDYIKFINICVKKIIVMCMDILQQPSCNMDDSGFFSIQVICRALEVWNLAAIPYSSPKVEIVRQNPSGENAFICNLQQHWFTIRKLGRQWFNLNSVASGPELISETYLSLFLTQLQNEGEEPEHRSRNSVMTSLTAVFNMHDERTKAVASCCYSIFVVRGELPDCESDQMLTLLPVDPTKVKSTSTRGKSKNTSQNFRQEPSERDQVDIDKVRRKREQFYSARFNDAATSAVRDSQTISSPSQDETEEEMLERAVALSLTQG